MPFHGGRYNHSAADVVVKGQTLREWFLDDYIFHNSDGVDGFCETEQTLRCPHAHAPGARA